MSKTIRQDKNCNSRAGAKNHSLSASLAAARCAERQLRNASCLARFSCLLCHRSPHRPQHRRRPEPFSHHLPPQHHHHPGPTCCCLHLPCACSPPTAPCPHAPRLLKTDASSPPLPTSPVPQRRARPRWACGPSNCPAHPPPACRSSSFSRHIQRPALNPLRNILRGGGRRGKDKESKIGPGHSNSSNQKRSCARGLTAAGTSNGSAGIQK